MNKVGTKVYTIDVGKLSPKDAEKLMKEMIKKYSYEIRDLWDLLV